MSTALEGLLAEGVIDAIIGQLKSGKEAEVWLVEHQGEIVAAKLYKERHARSFRNNSGYREGREVRSSRTARAMAKGSRFGVAAAEEAWRSAEVDALYALHAAGVRVPAPVVFYEGVLLMELVIDPGGHPAPRLIETPPASAAEAEALYEDLRGQVIRMLAVDLVHGDLSPYNILSAWNGPTLIDFPQTIAAAKNSSAERYFKRDLDGVRVYLAGFAPSLVDRDWETDDIWRAYLKGELSPEYVPNPAHRKSRLAEAGRRGVRRGARGGLRDDPTPATPIQATHFDRSAFSVPEPEAIVATARPGETDEEAELRALEATLLRQGGGSRGKPPGASKEDAAQGRRGGRGGPRSGGARSGRPGAGPRGPARDGARPAGGPPQVSAGGGGRSGGGAQGSREPRPAAPAQATRGRPDDRGPRGPLQVVHVSAPREPRHARTDAGPGAPLREVSRTDARPAGAGQHQRGFSNGERREGGPRRDDRSGPQQRGFANGERANGERRDRGPGPQQRGFATGERATGERREGGPGPQQRGFANGERTNGERREGSPGPQQRGFAKGQGERGLGTGERREKSPREAFGSDRREGGRPQQPREGQARAGGDLPGRPRNGEARADAGSGRRFNGASEGAAMNGRSGPRQRGAKNGRGEASHGDERSAQRSTKGPAVSFVPRRPPGEHS